MIGTTLAHYRIVSLLGKGGMGEVYRARDTTLDRDVALKVLPADLARDSTRLERFRREAKIVAGLNHPHIVTLYSVEEDAGVHFLTMEVVEGQGLDEALTSEGLPVSSVLDIGISIADALAAAHERGIVHRDLKPHNIRLTRDGHTKVLDFGLAKLIERTSAPEDAPTELALTTEGTILGTVPYMAPEQLRGLAVDHRSDIFSLGVLLYECATGRRPFSGATKTDIISSILRDTPPPVGNVKPDLPAQLGRVVARCLEKNPEDRYDSAKDVRNELRDIRRQVESGGFETAGSESPFRTRWLRRSWIAVGLIAAVIATLAWIVRDRYAARTGASGDTSEKTIAVLPFANMSVDPDQEYFSDGISEELLNLLSQLPELRVAARTSSFSFKGQNVEIPEIAKKLNVAYVLEGSVRRAGEQVRITAQLIHASDGFHVWSETYDRKLDDIFAVQDEIAGDVVRELQVKLLGAAPITRKTDPEAYALFLQSRAIVRHFTPEAFATSDSLLERALKIDSTYAPAWVHRGINLMFESTTGIGGPAGETLAHALASVDRGLALDSRYTDGYSARASIEMLRRDQYAAAAKDIEHALSLEPTDISALGVAANLLSDIGRDEEAIGVFEELARRDPVNPGPLYNLAIAQIRTGRLDEAITNLRTVLSLSPGNGVTHYQIGMALFLKGDASAALAEFEQETIEAFKMIGLPLAYHALGRKAEEDAAMTALIKKYERDAAVNIAGIYAANGDADAAFKWLEKERSNGGSFSDIALDPTFRSIYQDPRWLPLLRSVGKAPEQLAKIEFNVTVPRTPHVPSPSKSVITRAARAS